MAHHVMCSTPDAFATARKIQDNLSPKVRQKTRYGASAVLHATAWSVTEFKKGQPQGAHTAWSAKMRYDFDCPGDRYRVRAFMVMSGHMGAGKMLDSSTAPKAWKQVSPNSAGAKMLGTACGKDMSVMMDLLGEVVQAEQKQTTARVALYKGLHEIRPRSGGVQFFIDMDSFGFIDVPCVQCASGDDPVMDGLLVDGFSIDVIQDFTAPMTTGNGTKYYSYRLTVLYDSRQEKIRVVNQRAYTGHMGKGTLLGKAPDQEWMDAGKDTDSAITDVATIITEMMNKDSEYLVEKAEATGHNFQRKDRDAYNDALVAQFHAKREETETTANPLRRMTPEEIKASQSRYKDEEITASEPRYKD